MTMNFSNNSSCTMQTISVWEFLHYFAREPTCVTLPSIHQQDQQRMYEQIHSAALFPLIRLSILAFDVVGELLFKSLLLFRDKLFSVVDLFYQKSPVMDEKSDFSCLPAELKLRILCAQQWPFPQLGSFVLYLRTYLWLTRQSMCVLSPFQSRFDLPSLDLR